MMGKGNRHMSGEDPKVEKLSKPSCLEITKKASLSDIPSLIFLFQRSGAHTHSLMLWKGECSTELVFVVKNRSPFSTPVGVY